MTDELETFCAAVRGGGTAPGLPSVRLVEMLGNLCSYFQGSGLDHIDCTAALVADSGILTSTASAVLTSLS